MKHPHADLMLQYAQDAMTTDEPWDLWEVKDGLGWYHCVANPVWVAHYEYRRKAEKPKTVVKWLWANPYGNMSEALLTVKEAAKSKANLTIKLEWSRTEFTE